MTMTEKKSGIRLSRLTIKNYKKLNSLEIDFPRPVMKGDADILVFGSKNGGGKTSVLECCSLLMLAGIVGERFELFRENDSLLDVANLLVKAGQEQASIEGKFEQDSKECTVSLTINHRTGFSKPNIKGEKSLFKPFGNTKRYFDELDYPLNSILAFSGEPLIMPPLLHFNSYRKVQESNPELGMMADDYPRHRVMRVSTRSGIRNITNPVSSFKLEILRSLMGRAALFEGINKKESQSVLSQLNNLIQRYCGGQIEHLRPLPDNKVDIRIKPSTGGESFSFDGLSSGQKEMIATLFLIWRNTQEQPCIVLIDEPELHLNAEWHGDFVRQLYKLAPQNQYILATHSEEMFRSVDEEYRAVLVPDNDNGIPS
jgi:predicted ATP-binding protein involved in virulence